MSTVPKARRSNVVDVTVTPAGWDAHPEISRSNITNCTFKDLSSATNIERSELSRSTIQPSSTKKGSRIDRSKVHDSQVFSARILRSELDHCSVTGSTVERSKLQNCSVAAPNNIARTEARATKFISSKLVERSQLNDSVVLGDSTLERCIVRDTIVADKSTCERSELDSSVITRSKIERSKVSDCDVMDCVMERTDFKGMILKYGIWKRGDLIGRTSDQHEVVIRPRQQPLSTAEPSSPLPTPSFQTSGPGWKAAEAERDRLPVEDEDEEDENSLGDLEDSSDDETVDPLPDATKRAKTHKKSNRASMADTSDPPPPYEQ
ncbi:hypothetical protein UA08_02159 [Talaromyces atroroseus]|uniref:Uncharacterized protein n=1 Tax=Talaromyces atroroseus TaxID=1441469 RepID=A0A225B6N9_TALAT|nr:hypothetical protein UA08_02159 [Talaromyces atroroseus]OKL62535.1 hypothetical protein UA08_02159 [Talaromyces atroroseus]